MEASAFAIVNVKKRKAKPCAILRVLKDGNFKINISAKSTVKDVPAFFVPFLKSGEFTIENDLARRWVRERITPTGRQNLGEILKANNLKEYDEISLLRASCGKSSQDDFEVLEIIDLDNQNFDNNCLSTSATHREKEALVKLGTTIKNRRELLGYSQKKLADIIGVKQPVISRIESGKGNPTFSILIALNDALVIDGKTFLGF